MSSDVEQGIKEMIVERCFLSIDPTEIGEGDDLIDTIGLDSVQILEIVVGLEETFGVSFEDADFDIDNFRSVSAIAAQVREKTN